MISERLMTRSTDDFEAAVRVLADMIFHEWPGDSLAEIVATWGSATPEQFEALERVEEALGL